MKQKRFDWTDWLRLGGLVLVAIAKIVGWVSDKPPKKPGTVTKRRPSHPKPPSRSRAERSQHWTEAATERCARAKQRQKWEAQAARQQELNELRAQAGQKPPIEDAVDCTPYLDDADIAAQRRDHLRYSKRQQDGMPD